MVYYSSLNACKKYKSEEKNKEKIYILCEKIYDTELHNWVIMVNFCIKKGQSDLKKKKKHNPWTYQIPKFQIFIHINWPLNDLCIRTVSASVYMLSCSNDATVWLLVSYLYFLFETHICTLSTIHNIAEKFCAVYVFIFNAVKHNPVRIMWENIYLLLPVIAYDISLFRPFEIV